MLRTVGLHNGLASVVGRRASQASMRAFGTHKDQSSLERHRSSGGLLASASRSFEQRGDDLLFGAPSTHCAFSSTPQTHWIWQRKSWRFSSEKKEKKKFKLPKLSDLGTLDGWDPNAPFTYPPPPNEDDKARAIRVEKEKLINQYYSHFFPARKWVYFFLLFGFAYGMSKFTEWTDSLARDVLGEKVVSIVYESPEKFVQWVNDRPTTFSKTFLDLFDGDLSVIFPKETKFQWFMQRFITGYPKRISTAEDEDRDYELDETFIRMTNRETGFTPTAVAALNEQREVPTFLEEPALPRDYVITEEIDQELNEKYGVPPPLSEKMNETALKMFAEENNFELDLPPERLKDNVIRIMADLRVLKADEFIRRVDDNPPDFLKASPFSTQVKQQEVGKITIDHRFLRVLPLRIMSRLWGYMAEFPVPRFLMPHLISVYSIIYNCDLTEIDMDNSTTTADKGTIIHHAMKPYYFRTLQDFFTRRIRPETRPIAPSDAVSPVDGTVLSIGYVDENNQVEQVKGLNYDVGALLGMTPKKKDPKNKILHTIIYLAPGDYHGIHAPTEFKLQQRNHFMGYLLPVATIVARTVPSLFAINERVGLVGEWQHGFFSITAVGATNVGSISLKHEPDFTTNNTGDFFNVKTLGNQVPYTKFHNEPVQCSKGEEIAFFRMGSTVVIVMEVPPEFGTEIVPGQIVKLGQPLGSMPPPPPPPEVPQSRFSLFTKRKPAQPQ